MQKCWLGRLPCACVRLNCSKSDQYASDSLHVRTYSGNVAVPVHWMRMRQVSAGSVPVHVLGLAPSCEQHSTSKCNFSRRAHIDEANVQLLKKRSTSSPLFFSPPFCASACFFWWSDSEYYYYVTTWKYKEYTLVLYKLCYIKWTVSSNTTASSCSDMAPVLLPSSRFEMCSSFKNNPQSSTGQAPPRPRLKLPRPACHHRL